MRPLFPPGLIGISEAAERAFKAAAQNPLTFVLLHVTGAWDAYNAPHNRQALAEGGMVISQFVLNTGVRIVVGTTADRSETGICLMSEVSD